MGVTYQPEGHRPASSCARSCKPSELLGNGVGGCSPAPIAAFGTGHVGPLRVGFDDGPTVLGDVVVLAGAITVSIGYVAGARLLARIGLFAATTWSLLIAAARAGKQSCSDYLGRLDGSRLSGPTLRAHRTRGMVLGVGPRRGRFNRTASIRATDCQPHYRGYAPFRGPLRDDRSGAVPDLLWSLPFAPRAVKPVVAEIRKSTTLAT